VSIAPKLDLRARHRVMTILAVAMLVSVGVNWAVVEILARLGTVRYPFPGQAWLGHVLLAIGVGVVIAAGIVRRSLLARGPADAGDRAQMASVVSFALAEVPAVGGLMVFVLTGVREAAYPLFVVSFAGLLLYFPRWGQWEEWAKAR
jgi:hypothetical protein